MNTENDTQAITMIEVQSKQIRSIGYGGGVLAIEFAPRAGEARGSVYEYQGVTKDMFEDFLAAQSKGNYFYNHIKNDKEKYPFKKVKNAEPLIEPTEGAEQAA